MASQYICTSCGYIGKPIKKTPGNFLIEVVLWIAFILPGLIYSLWRVSNKYYVCATCHHKTVIPVDTPMGKQLADKVKSQ
jgi:uncharacterized membrane protein YqaE (UPF0057 family)